MGRSSKKTRNSRNKKDGKMKELKERLDRDGIYPTMDEVKGLHPTASIDELIVLAAYAFINTREGREWLYAEAKKPGIKPHMPRAMMLLIELANYKFPIGGTDV